MVEALLVPGALEPVVRRPAVVDHSTIVVAPQDGPGHGAAAGEVDAEEAVQAARDLAVGESALLVQLDDGRLSVGTQLGSGGPQGIGGLQRVPALEALLAVAAAADMDVELAPDRAARDLDLVLVGDVGFLDGPAAVGAGERQRCLVDFVDGGG